MANQLLQKLDRNVDLIFSHVETRRECENILVVPADVQNQTAAPAASIKIALHSFGKHSIGQLSIRFVAIFATDFDSQRHPDAVGVANYLRITSLQLSNLSEEIGAFALRCLGVIAFLHHAHSFESNRRSEWIRGES